MSAVDTGSNDLDAPVATPTPPVVPPVVPQAADDGFARIPKDQIPGGDWHEVQRKANAYDEMSGYEDDLKALQANNYRPGDVVQQFSGVNAQPPQPQAGMSTDEMRGMLAQEREANRQSLTEALQGHTEQLRQEQYDQQYGQYESEYTEQFLDKVGAPKDGPMREMFRHEYQKQLSLVMQESAPEELQYGTDEFNRYYARPSADHTAAASERCDFIKNYEFNALANAAENQESVPSETLGGGPGGGATQQNWDEMSHAQQNAQLKDGLPTDGYD